MFDRVFPRTSPEDTRPVVRFDAFRPVRPAPFPKKARPVTFARFDVPRTFRVCEPNTTAEFAKRLVTFKVSILAVPRTYKLDPDGGLTRVPIETPFEYVTFPALLVH